MKIILSLLLFFFISWLKPFKPYSPGHYKNAKQFHAGIDSVSYDTTLYGNGTKFFAFRLPQSTNYDSVILMSKVSAHYNAVAKRVDELEYYGLNADNVTLSQDFNNTTKIRYPIGKAQLNLFSGTNKSNFVYVGQSSLSMLDKYQTHYPFFQYSIFISRKVAKAWHGCNIMIKFIIYPQPCHAYLSDFALNKKPGYCLLKK